MALRLSKVKIVWSSAFAYAIGLITSDGNLSKDGRHVNLTSKDKELIEMFKECLVIDNKIGRKSRGADPTNKKYFVVQFGDTNFYEFLLGIGLKPAKSKTLKTLKIPREFFADFFRGLIDGDGNIGYFWHPESKHPQLKIRLYSASPEFLRWVKNEITEVLDIQSGWIEYSKGDGIFRLTYAKSDSLKILPFMYNGSQYFLKRKYDIAKKFIGRVA